MVAWLAQSFALRQPANLVSLKSGFAACSAERLWSYEKISSAICSGAL